MSYAIESNADVRRVFARLEIPVQEETIDEIDRLAAGGGLLPGRPLPASVSRDLRVVTATGEHYVFIEARYDEPRRTLMVTRLGHFVRPGAS